MKIQSVGIIGFGDFGRFLHTLARDKFPSIAVKISSRSNPPDGEAFFPLEDVCTADLLFLTVPIRAYAETIEKVVPLIGENTIVCDVATVKKYTAGLLRERGVRRFIATHPMFGPYSYAKQGNSLRDLRVAVCDSSLSHEDTRAIVEFLREGGLRVLEMAPDEHDKLVAETLFLTHLVGQTVKKGAFVRTSIDTVSFGFLMDAVESVAHDEALFHDVFKYNPYCKDVLARFESAEKHVAAILQKNGA